MRINNVANSGDKSIASIWIAKDTQIRESAVICHAINEILKLFLSTVIRA